MDINEIENLQKEFLNIIADYETGKRTLDLLNRIMSLLMQINSLVDSILEKDLQNSLRIMGYELYRIRDFFS